ncbi:MAG: ABC transporter permease [Candidatus Sericytochromatia bacterium]
MTFMWALYAREVQRFRKLLLDTIFSPIVSMVLYLAVFGVVSKSQTIDGISFLTFIYTGLLGMIMVNSGFSNPGFALIIAKNLGSIVDLQVAPIKSWQVGIAYALAALTRGLLTLTLAVALTIWFIPGMQIAHPVLLLATMLITGLQYGMLGVIFGMWAKGFEALTFVTTFVLQPMIFLAGVFYPITRLPAPWDTISAFNPVHHTINLFRYGFLGYTDTPLLLSWSAVGVITLIFFGLMNWMCIKKLNDPGQ